jgi:hypothetical protein
LLNTPSVTAFVRSVGLSQAVLLESASKKANVMTEYQEIAIGLLGLTHPEIYLSVRNGKDKSAQAASSALHSLAMQARQPSPGGAHSSAAFRAVKFAFAALVAGSRAAPLGDNGQLTRELGAYGERLSH